MDIKTILFRYQLNVSYIINNSTLAIMQTYVTFWQNILKMQKDNTKVLLMMLKDLKKISRSRRRFWMKTRSKHWWKIIVSNHFLNEDWLECFRMKRSTFQFICEELRSELCPAIPFLVSREPLSVEVKVAITLYYLASCCEYRVVANIFGVHKTSVWRCVHDTVDAINKILLPKLIKMPDINECAMISAAYEARTNVPQVIGAIDGTHIPILPPVDGYKDYVNRKGWPSIILQAVVDNNLRFRNVNCQAPGSCHDAAVFRKSMLYKEAERIIPKKTELINGVEIPYFLVGDPAYPLLPWLMKGYTKTARLIPQEESFNVYLNSNRVDVEMAFGRLKSRWRCLSKRIDLHYTSVPKVVIACCVLHNVMELKNEPILPQWMQSVESSENIFPQPSRNECRTYDSYDASNTRDALRDYMTQFPLRKSYQIT